MGQGCIPIQVGRIYCCQGRKKALKVCWAHSFSPVIKVELRLAYLCWEVSRDLWLVLTWVQISIYPSGRQFLIQPAPLRVSVRVVLMDTWWLLSQLRAQASVGRGFENRWNFNLLEWTACPITLSSLMANDLSFVGVSRALGLWWLSGGEGLDLVAQLPIADTSRCVRCFMPITIKRDYCISSCTRIFQACFRMPEVSHIIRWKSTDQPHSSHLFCGALYFSSARVSSSKDSNRVLVVSWNGRTHFLVCNFQWSEPKA